jgi:hypothetical protein
MTAKTLFVASALLLSATSATLAQGYGYGAPYGYRNAPNGYSLGLQYGTGVYDFAPGYGYDNGGYDNTYRARGGPGPRVGNGAGAGVGSQR